MAPVAGGMVGGGGRIARSVRTTSGPLVERDAKVRSAVIDDRNMQDVSRRCPGQSGS
jgi:hypothetical protein